MAEDDRLKCAGIGIRLGDAFETMRREASDEYSRVTDSDANEVDDDAIQRVSMYFEIVREELGRLNSACGLGRSDIDAAVADISKAIDAVPEPDSDEDVPYQTAQVLMETLYGEIGGLDTLLRNAFPAPKRGG